jgi:hypothetical protein
MRYPKIDKETEKNMNQNVNGSLDESFEEYDFE